MISERLIYHPVELATLDTFHALVQDEHVRRYLMDGQIFDRAWSEERVRDSQALFERRGVGMLENDAATSGFHGGAESWLSQRRAWASP